MTTSRCYLHLTWWGQCFINISCVYLYACSCTNNPSKFSQRNVLVTILRIYAAVRSSEESFFIEDGCTTHVYATGVAFTTLLFLCNLQIGPINESVWHWQAFPVQCYVTLQLIGLIRKLQRKCSVVNMAPAFQRGLREWKERCYLIGTRRIGANVRKLLRDEIIFKICWSVCPWQISPAQSNVCG